MQSLVAMLARFVVVAFGLVLIAFAFVGEWGVSLLPEGVPAALLIPLNWVVPTVFVARWAVLGWLDGIAGALVPKYSLLLGSGVALAIAESEVRGRQLSPDCASSFGFAVYVVIFFPTLLAGMIVNRYFLLGDRIRLLMDRLPFATSPLAILVDKLVGLGVNGLAAASLWALIMRQGGHRGPWVRAVDPLVEGLDTLGSKVPFPSFFVPSVPEYYEKAGQIARITGGRIMGLGCSNAPGTLPRGLVIATLIVYVFIGALIVVTGCDPILYRNTRAPIPDDAEHCPDCGGVGLYGIVASPAHSLRGRLLRGILCRKCLGTGIPVHDEVPVNPRSLQFLPGNGNPAALVTRAFMQQALATVAVGFVIVTGITALQWHVP